MYLLIKYTNRRVIYIPIKSVLFSLSKLQKSKKKKNKLNIRSTTTS